MTGINRPKTIDIRQTCGNICTITISKAIWQILLFTVFSDNDFEIIMSSTIYDFHRPIKRRKKNAPINSTALKYIINAKHNLTEKKFYSKIVAIICVL